MDNATPVISHTNRVFTLFPKLPLELRRKIWKHTLPGPACSNNLHLGHARERKQSGCESNMPH